MLYILSTIFELLALVYLAQADEYEIYAPVFIITIY